jgi:hypothetical protein
LEWICWGSSSWLVALALLYASIEPPVVAYLIGINIMQDFKDYECVTPDYGLKNAKKTNEKFVCLKSVVYTSARERHVT